MSDYGNEVKALIKALDLTPHPEGGFYKETFRDEAVQDGRSVGTAIYYLLSQGERSAWHRVDASEIWHFYAGAPLKLEISQEGEGVEAHSLGAHFAKGERPQIIVPKGAWQSAYSMGAWTLVGCTVAPGFIFEGFEMAPPNWAPRES